VQAQAVLAELLAPLLDVIYGSQEKERVVALLTALMYNITPYLKNHRYGLKHAVNVQGVSKRALRL
jgi:hypothetical protein